MPHDLGSTYVAGVQKIMMPLLDTLNKMIGDNYYLSIYTSQIRPVDRDTIRSSSRLSKGPGLAPKLHLQALLRTTTITYLC